MSDDKDTGENVVPMMGRRPPIPGHPTCNLHGPIEGHFTGSQDRRRQQKSHLHALRPDNPNCEDQRKRPYSYEPERQTITGTSAGPMLYRRHTEGMSRDARKKQQNILCTAANPLGVNRRTKPYDYTANEAEAAGAPVNLGRARVERSDRADDWTPIDVMRNLLREMEAGLTKPETIVICWTETKQGPTGPAELGNYTQSGNSAMKAIGLLDHIKFRMNKGEG